MRSPVGSPFLLRYRNTVLRMVCAPGWQIDGVLEFLASHFQVCADTDLVDPVATIRIAPKVRPVGGAGPAADVFVRRSASDFFTIPARRIGTGVRERIECTRTGTVVVFDRERREIDVAPGRDRDGDADLDLDLIEVIRDVVLKHQENSGALVLHAAAAYGPSGAVLVSGPKGAGKSTVVMELVANGGLRLMSGDKTLVHLCDGELRCSGWPDYPHLGYGTLSKYAGLAELAGLPADYRPSAGHAFSPVGKFPVDPAGFRARFPITSPGLAAPVACVVYPSIGPGTHTALVRVEHPPEAAAGNVESAFAGATASWNHYQVDRTGSLARTRAEILSRLAGVPAFTLVGPGDLGPAEVAPLVSPSEGDGRP